MTTTTATAAAPATISPRRLRALAQQLDAIADGDTFSAAVLSEARDWTGSPVERDACAAYLRGHTPHGAYRLRLQDLANGMRRAARRAGARYELDVGVVVFEDGADYPELPTFRSMRAVRRWLRAEYGYGRYRIDSDDRVHAYGRMPNSQTDGWHLVGTLVTLGEPA